MASHDRPIEIGLVVLGASQFEIPTLEPNQAFARSKEAFVSAMMGAGGSGERMIDLFDSPKSVTDIISQIEHFLKHNRSLTDVIIYYCGHGGITGANELYLTLRKTREHWEDYESITLGPLRRRLRDQLSSKRVYLILDCCYAGRAASQWMSVGGINPAIGGSVFQAFPKSGSALIAASQADRPAVCLHDAEQTVFTGALVRVLRHGIDGGGSKLSLREIFDQAQDLIASEHTRDVPRPELYPFASDHSDVANTPIFANAASNRKPRPAVSPPPRPTAPPVVQSRGLLSIADSPDHAPRPNKQARSITRIAAAIVGLLLAIAVIGSIAFQYTTGSVPTEQKISNQDARQKLTEALEELDSLAAIARADTSSVDPCAKLFAAGVRLDQTIRQASQSDYARAQGSIQSCKTLFAGSDERISETRASAAALNMGFAPSVERLAKARKALTKLDLDRLPSGEKNNLLSTGDRAADLIERSDKRIGPLIDADRAASRNRSAATLRALADSAKGITDFDMGRNIAGIFEALTNARNASADFTASQTRWSTLESAIGRAGRESIEYYWRPLNEAMNGLTSLDRELASPQQRDLLLRGQDLLKPATQSKAPTPSPSPRKTNDDWGTIPAGR